MRLLLWHVSTIDNSQLQGVSRDERV